MNDDLLLNICLLLSFINIVATVYTQISYLYLAQNVYTYEQSIHELKLRNRELEKQISQQSSLRYIQEKAFELGYQKDRRYIYILPQ